MLNRLESEKSALLSELNKLRQEKKVWDIQRSELEMSQAELSAENTQLRSELNNKVLLSHCLIPARSGCFDEQSVEQNFAWGYMFRFILACCENLWKSALSQCQNETWTRERRGSKEGQRGNEGMWYVEGIYNISKGPPQNKVWEMFSGFHWN